MSFSYTALQLVNRIRRSRRLDDVASIANTEDLAALDSLNNAIEEVLSSRRWEFDLRKSQFSLKASRTGTFSVTSGNTFGSYTETASIPASAMAGNFVLRLNPTGSTSYGGTALRVNTTLTLGSSSIVVFPTAVNETMSSVACTAFYSEYIMADTVRDVVRVTYQEEPLTLENIGPAVEWDELYPRPHIEYGPPETISVGGYDTPTYVNSGSADPELRLIVWPVPDDDYILDYTYYYRHPELTGASSTLVGVPPDVVAKIVDKAAARMKAYYEKDYNALALDGRAEAKLEEIHRRAKGQSADRKVVGNWEGMGSRHRRYGSLTNGRLIGGS